MAAWIFAVYFLTQYDFVYGSNQQLGLAVPGSNPEMFFDADTTRFTRDGKQQHFEGHVVAIGVGTLIASDRLFIDREKNRFEASGHVLVISKEQVFAGERLIYDLATGDFSLSMAWMVVGDSKTSSEVAKQTLGITQSEVQFEVERLLRLSELQTQKELLIEKYQHHMQVGAIDKAALVTEEYAIVLAREELIKNQENPSIAKLSSESRESIKSRRQFWEKSKQALTGVTTSISQIGYFRIEGQEIKRTGENVFQAEEAYLTPCRCETDESPAWSFRAKKIDASIGGYADLYDPVIEIKGIPVFYIPYLKIPIKGKRQSGFLLPNVVYSSRNGTVFTQPLFLAIDNRQDATITTDYFEKRGLRLGVEYRIEQRQYSGWRLKFEAMRDQAWEQTYIDRKRIVQSYQSSLQLAKQAYEKRDQNSAVDWEQKDWQWQPFDPPKTILSSPAWWNKQGLSLCLDEENYEQCKTSRIHDHLSIPSSPWRGQIEWQGQSFLTSRLQFVSEGMLLSDHRYLGDLFVPNSEVVFSQVEPKLYAHSRWQIHLDGKQFYLGAGGQYGDYMLTNERFSGLQQPFSLKLQSSLFPIFPSSWSVSAYGQFDYEGKIIDGGRLPGLDFNLGDKTSWITLGDGLWQSLRLRLVSPIVTDSLITIDHFTDLEMRHIQHELNFANDYLKDDDKQKIIRNSEDPTTIKTWKTGLNFNLPIDGKMLIGKENSPALNKQAASYLEHRMNWGVTLSLRPSVVTRGHYGQIYHSYRYDDKGQLYAGRVPLTYFESDALTGFSNQLIDEKNTMFPHQKIIFTTFHDWFISRNEWQRIPGSISQSKLLTRQEGDSSKYYHEMAKRELATYLDKPVTAWNEMFDESGQWLTSRYNLTESNRTHPVHFDANISFDYRKEKSRNELKKQSNINQDSLPKPWSPLESRISLNLFNFSVGSQSKYDIYLHAITNMSFTMNLPITFGIASGLSYQIDRDIRLNSQGDYDVYETRTREMSLTGSLFSTIQWGALYGVKVDMNNREQLPQRTGKLATTYLSPSDCWGLKFEWQKQYSDLDWHKGSYLFTLIVRFFGYYRDYGNFLGRYNDSF